MDNELKNTAAIRLLIRELTCDRPFDPDEIRLQCKTVVYTCFLMEIEPHELPLSDHIKGNLSQNQKSDFWQQFLSLYLDVDGERFRSISRMLENDPAWSPLLNLADQIIGGLSAKPRKCSVSNSSKISMRMTENDWYSRIH